MNITTKKKQTATVESLTDEVTALKKELQNCLDTPWQPGSIEVESYGEESRIHERLRYIIVGALQNNTFWDKDDQGQSYEIKEESYYDWFYFRAAIFGASEELKEYWADKDFRGGIDFLNEIIHDLMKIKHKYSLEEDHKHLLFNISREALSSQLARPVSLLIEVAKKMQSIPSAMGIVERFTVYEIILALETIIHCQKVYSSIKKVDDEK
jgi:hypothetical protein